MPYVESERRGKTNHYINLFRVTMNWSLLSMHDCLFYDLSYAVGGNVNVMARDRTLLTSVAKKKKAKKTRKKKKGKKKKLGKKEKENGV